MNEFLLSAISDPQTDATVDRRYFIKGGTVAVGGVVFGAAFAAPACDKKPVGVWIVTMTAGFSEMKPLLPDLGLSQEIVNRVSGFIDRGASIARQFDQAYRDGKFADAISLFSNLSGLITSVATELKVVDNRIVKLALVSVSIARIGIATLLNQQSTQPQVADAISRSRSAVNASIESEIKRLAETPIEPLLKSLL